MRVTEYIASILRVEKLIKQEINKKQTVKTEIFIMYFIKIRNNHNIVLILVCRFPN